MFSDDNWWPFPDQSSAQFKKISRMTLARILWGVGDNDWRDNRSTMELHVKNSLGNDFNASVQSILRKFFSELKKKFHEAKYDMDTFITKNGAWLDYEYEFPVSKKLGGRPLKDITSVNCRTKESRTKFIRENFSIADLSAALEVAYVKSGHRSAGRIVRNVHQNPKGAGKYKVGIRNRKRYHKRISPEAALAMLVESNLSKNDYFNLKRYMRRVLPNYNYIVAEKAKVYPKGITVGEDFFEVGLQELLDKTVERICLAYNIPGGSGLRLHWKWGMDGSSGQSEYNQGLGIGAGKDSNIFMICVVPLRLETLGPYVYTLWENPNPSSPFLCRPVKFFFAKEDADLIRLEKLKMQSQIDNLINTNLSLGGGSISISHSLVPSMVDGKVANALSHCPSAMTCNLCRLNSSDFNNPAIVFSKSVDESHMDYGLSTLHCWIRALEWCLKLAYRLKMKKWQVRGPTMKAVVRAEKRFFQAQFWNEMSLLIDRPKANVGSSNNGNTARKFFTNYAHSASILGLDVDFVYNLYVILQLITSNRKFDLEKFRSFCFNTYIKYTDLYNWYPIPTSWHKVLIHGADIINRFENHPIGSLSEEALESSHKYFKSYRCNLARKFSREDNNLDVGNRHLLASDPVVFAHRKKFYKTHDYCPEAEDMFI